MEFVAVDINTREVNMRVKLSSKEKFKLWFKTLFYHTSFSFNYAMDTVVEPLFWFVDHYVVFLGRFFVFMVGLLIGSIVLIAHLVGIPIYWELSPRLTICLFLIGYWLIINISFNFIQAVRVSPGLPNNPKLITYSVTICKKCISPKPSRTHHCSICNRCYLNMDHHCPWVNNCIGHLNRRYFFLCMVYIVTGCLFVMIFGLNLAYRQIIEGEDVLHFKERSGSVTHNPNERFESDNNVGGIAQLFPIDILFSSDLGKNTTLPLFSSYSTEQAELLFGILISKAVFLVILYYAAILCIGACLALGGLAIWHGKLITKGETSIEYHINKVERRRLGENFKNPYDLGRRKNWEVFFGLDQKGKSFWRHVLLPSTHRPTGNGYEWSHLTIYAMESFENSSKIL